MTNWRLDTNPDCCTQCRIENRACMYHASFGLYPSPPEGTRDRYNEHSEPDATGYSRDETGEKESSRDLWRRYAV